MRVPLRQRLLATTLILSSAGVATPALAQLDATADAGEPIATVDTAGSADIGESIVVTGSRIARPGVAAPTPVTSIAADELMATGSVSIGDALNDLPSLGNTFSQSSSTAFIGTTGLNLLDLRDLGTSRTLVLVNGRRHITSLEGEFTVDVNTIPVDLIDRVDVVTGGSSAVYGSDAIAGVVNFVLKRDFEGITGRLQGGISDKGDRGTYTAAITGGKNFGEGRGNVAVSLEYSRANPVFYTDRPDLTGAYTGRRQFNLQEPTGGEPQAGDGIPDNLFFEGIRSVGSSNNGTFIPYNGASSTVCVPGNLSACRENGVPRVWRFNPNGSLYEADYGTRDFRPFGSGNTLGGDGAILNDTGVLNPALTRYSANIIGHYDISDAFKPYFEAKYVRVESMQESSPTFASGGSSTNPAWTSNSVGIPIFLDNAYLDPAAAGEIRSLLTSANNPDPSFFRLQRQNQDFGIRGEFAKRQTYRAVVGVEGQFNDDWHYDVSLNYGAYDNRVISRNNRIEQRFRNSVDAVRNAAGDIVCRINQTTVVDPSCAPVNLFGFGSPSQAALDYFMTDTTFKGRAREYVASGFISGDSSELFELPGGPIGFSVGAEYRRETASSAYDDLVSSGQTFLNQIADFNPPAFEVKEAFGELLVPVLKNARFAEELTLQAAGRVADYKGATGTQFSYNAGAVYAPIRDIKLRVNYARSVRAPTLGDLYASTSENFQFVDDPCDTLYIGEGTDTRAANCAAAGIGADFINAPARSATISTASGGNADLTAEKSDSWTYGVVVQPRFLPGLSITADYYDIRVKNVIRSLTAQQILDNCYDGASLQNAFCGFVTRDASTGFFAPQGVIQAPLNFASMVAKGVDLDVAYRHKFSQDLSADLRFIGTWVKTRTDYPYFEDTSFPERIKGEFGTPEYAFNASANVKYRNVTLGYQARYIGKQSVTDYEAQHDYNDTPAYNADQYSPANYPAVWYHDLRVGMDVGKNYNFYVGVDNLTDRKPPLGNLGTDIGIYDNVGRFFYAGVKASF